MMDKPEFRIKYRNFTYQQYANKVVFLFRNYPSDEVLRYLKEHRFYKVQAKFSERKGGYAKRLTNVSLLEASKVKWLLR